MNINFVGENTMTLARGVSSCSPPAKAKDGISYSQEKDSISVCHSICPQHHHLKVMEEPPVRLLIENGAQTRLAWTCIALVAIGELAFFRRIQITGERDVRRLNLRYFRKLETLLVREIRRRDPRTHQIVNDVDRVV